MTLKDEMKFRIFTTTEGNITAYFSDEEIEIMIKRYPEVDWSYYEIPAH